MFVHIHKSIRDPQKKKVKNGDNGGRRRFHAAHTSRHKAANPPWAMPIVIGRCFLRPRENTSSGSVPRFDAINEAAPREKRTRAVKYDRY
jgi:hypothetical protein